MIIDSHQHVFWHGRDDAALIADMDENGIDLAWLLNWDIDPDEDNPKIHYLLNPIHLRPDGTHAGIPLSDLLKAKRHYPERFVLGYCPNPRLSNAPAVLESAVRMYGVRICGEWKYRMLLDDPRSLELFRKAGELKCPVVLHLDCPYLRNAKTGKQEYQHEWYGGTADNLERTLQSCPQTTFIGHGPGFWACISGDANEPSSHKPKQSYKDAHTLSGTGLLLDADADINEMLYPTGSVERDGRLPVLLEKYPNLYADVSAGSGLNALKRDPEHAVGFLSRFADRILFGRDYYGPEHQNFLNSLKLSEKVYQAIYWRNADRLIGKTSAHIG